MLRRGLSATSAFQRETAQVSRSLGRGLLTFVVRSAIKEGVNDFRAFRNRLN
jgi:hypothetical protein